MVDEATREEDASLLVVVLDTNPLVWSRRANDEGESASAGPSSTSTLSLRKVVEHISVFFGAFLVMDPRNILAVIAAHVGVARYLYSTPLSNREEGGKDHDDGEVEGAGVAAMQRCLHRKLAELCAEEVAHDIAAKGPRLSGALTLALCYINRLKRERSNRNARILTLSASPDVPGQYISLMNCIFSAQKDGVPVDACVLALQDSTFLQQASHLTGGIYLRPPRQTALLQYLMTVFMADRHSRKLLSLPRQPTVDYRAACFCHKRTVDMGYVCSVCLSSLLQQISHLFHMRHTFCTGSVAKSLGPLPKEEKGYSTSMTCYCINKYRFCS